MLNFIDKIKNIKLEIKINYAIIFTLLLVMIMQIIVNINLSDANNRSYKISIPPTLEFGASIKTDTKSKFEIYQFAGYIEQQLYFWQKDGLEDFKANIDNLSLFITPEYRQYLLTKYNNLLNLGELQGREKSLQPLKVFSSDFVTKNNNSWLVEIDFQAQEFIKNRRFKDKKQRHFVNVILRDVNPELNPWGLQLDVPKSEPKEIL